MSHTLRELVSRIRWVRLIPQFCKSSFRKFTYHSMKSIYTLFVCSDILLGDKDLTF